MIGQNGKGRKTLLLSNWFNGYLYNGKCSYLSVNYSGTWETSLKASCTKRHYLKDFWPDNALFYINLREAARIFRESRVSDENNPSLDPGSPFTVHTCMCAESCPKSACTILSRALYMIKPASRNTKVTNTKNIEVCDRHTRHR